MKFLKWLLKRFERNYRINKVSLKDAIYEKKDKILWKKK